MVIPEVFSSLNDTETPIRSSEGEAIPAGTSPRRRKSCMPLTSPNPAVNELLGDLPPRLCSSKHVPLSLQRIHSMVGMKHEGLCWLTQPRLTALTAAQPCAHSCTTGRAVTARTRSGAQPAHSQHRHAARRARLRNSPVPPARLALPQHITPRLRPTPEERVDPASPSGCQAVLGHNAAPSEVRGHDRRRCAHLGPPGGGLQGHGSRRQRRRDIQTGKDRSRGTAAQRQTQQRTGKGNKRDGCH